MNLPDLKKSFFGYQKESVCRYVDELEKENKEEILKTKEALDQYCREITELKQQLFDAKAENEYLQKELTMRDQKKATQKKSEEVTHDVMPIAQKNVAPEEIREDHNLSLFSRRRES